MILIAGDSRGYVDVLLVGKAHDSDLRPVEALADLLEAAFGKDDGMHLHELVDLAEVWITCRPDVHNTSLGAEAQGNCIPGCSFISAKL